MRTKLLRKPSTSAGIVKNALKNYETYVSHYKSRNLIPMFFYNFPENYKTSL